VHPGRRRDSGQPTPPDQDFALVVHQRDPYGTDFSAGAITAADRLFRTGAGNNSLIDRGRRWNLLSSLWPTRETPRQTRYGKPHVDSLSRSVHPSDGSSAYPTSGGRTGESNAGRHSSGNRPARQLACGSGVDLVLNVSTGQGASRSPSTSMFGSKNRGDAEFSPGTDGRVDKQHQNSNSPSSPRLPRPAGTVRSVHVDVNITKPDSRSRSLYLSGFTSGAYPPLGTPVTLHYNPLRAHSLVDELSQYRLAQIAPSDASREKMPAASDPCGHLPKQFGLQWGRPHGPVLLRHGEFLDSSCDRGRRLRRAPLACLPTPPEVSAPDRHSSDPRRDPGTGMVTFTWENQGSASDSTASKRGTSPRYRASRITSSNTAAIQCGSCPQPPASFPPRGISSFSWRSRRGQPSAPSERPRILCFPRLGQPGPVPSRRTGAPNERRVAGRSVDQVPRSTGRSTGKSGRAAARR